MANVNDTDTFLVNRSNSSYQLQAQNLMAELRDDDLMLVNRNGKSYKATGAEIKESLKPPADVLKPQILAPADGAGQLVGPKSDEITNVQEDTPVAGQTTLTLASPKDITKFTADMEVEQDNAAWANTGTSTTYRVCYIEHRVGGVPPGPPAALIGVDENIFLTAPTDGIYHPHNTSYNDYYSLPTKYNNDGIINPPASDQGWVLYDTGVCVSAGTVKINPGDSAFKVYYITSKDGITWTPVRDTFATSGIIDITVGDRYIASYRAAQQGLVFSPQTAQFEGRRYGPTGTVVSASGVTIVLKDSVLTWSANTGNYVVGPESLSADAALDPSGVNFVGSTFASSDGSLTAGSADWQVAALADTGYTSPISQVTAHPEMTPVPQWTSGELEAETEYRARTKYKAATGEESEWSDDVTFKTDVGADPDLTTPGAITLVGPNDITTFRTMSSPTKLVDTTSSSNTIWAVGTDGKLYRSLLSGNDLTVVADTSNLKSVLANYRAAATNDAADKYKGLVTIDADGDRRVYMNENSNSYSFPADAQQGKIFTMFYKEVFLVVSDDKTKVYGIRTATPHVANFNGVTINLTWTNCGSPQLPAGVLVDEILMGNVDSLCVILGTDGKVYRWTNGSQAMLAGGRTEVTDNAKNIARCNFYSGAYTCYGILKNDGTIWAEAVGATNPFYIQQFPVQQVDSGSGRKWLTPPFCPYQSKAWYAIADDGFYYGGVGTFDATKLDLGDKPIKFPGHFYNSHSSYAGFPTALIVPE